jgi:hypothetical protein
MSKNLKFVKETPGSANNVAADVLYVAAVLAVFIRKQGLLVRYGAEWCIMLDMAKSERQIRRSIALPSHIAQRVYTMAKARKISANRVVVDLIEAGIQAKEAEKQRFFSLADRLAESNDSAERQRIKKELARMTFGD